MKGKGAKCKSSPAPPRPNNQANKAKECKGRPLGQGKGKCSPTAATAQAKKPALRTPPKKKRSSSAFSEKVVVPPIMTPPPRTGQGLQQSTATATQAAEARRNDERAAVLK